MMILLQSLFISLSAHVIIIRVSYILLCVKAIMLNAIVVC